MDSRWSRVLLTEVRDLRQEEAAEVAMVKAEAAEEEVKAEAEEKAEAVEVETAPPMLDQELVYKELEKMDKLILMLTNREVADSKARLEMPIQWTGNQEEAEVPETQMRRRAVPAEATGAPSQSKLTSKAAFLRERLERLLQRLRRSQSRRLRKKRYLNRRLKKSSSELVSMISCRLDRPETRPRQEKLRESRVPRLRP